MHMILQSAKFTGHDKIEEQQVTVGKKTKMCVDQVVF